MSTQYKTMDFEISGRELIPVWEEK